MNLMHPLLRVAIATCITAPAFAATIVVSPNGLIQYIAAGINHAVAGDTVKVLPGTYREWDIAIPSDKQGITIQGVGKVVVDASPTPGVMSSKGFLISAADTKIRGITVLGAKDTEPGAGVGGIAFDLFASGVTIENCSVIGCDSSGVFGLNVEITIKKTKFVRTGRPIWVVTPHCRIEDCSFDGCEGNNIDVTGGDVEIVGNKIRNAATFVDAGMAMSYGTAIRVTGNGAVITENVVENADSGVDVAATNIVVVENKVSNVVNGGLRVDGNCVITKNEVRAISNGDGIFFRNSNSAIIAENRVSHFARSGIFISPTASNVLVNSNQIDSGAVNSIGIHCEGANSTLTRNKVSHCRDGIAVFADGCTIEKNLCNENHCDGIDSRSNNATITKNKCVGNLGEGLENHGSAVTANDNTCSKNRIDVANVGTFASFSGNKFKTGGSTTPPDTN